MNQCSLGRKLNGGCACRHHSRQPHKVNASQKCYHEKTNDKQGCRAIRHCCHLAETMLLQKNGLRESLKVSSVAFASQVKSVASGAHPGSGHNHFVAEPPSCNHQKQSANGAQRPTIPPQLLA